MTKRQEALDAMAQLLQANPELWRIAGDLFVKNMDWPGAQEMAKRFARSIDPNILGDGSDESPELQAAKQQLQAMAQELDQVHAMLQRVGQSMEAQDLAIKEQEANIKAYEAETKRISAIQAGMTPEQIQDIVMGTISGMLDSGDLVGELPGREMMEEESPLQMPPSEGMAPEEAPIEQPMMPPEGT